MSMLSVARATVTGLNLEAEGDVQLSCRDVDYIRLNLEAEEGVKEMSSRLSRASRRRARETQRWHSRTLALQTERAHWRREAFAVCQMPIGAKWISILAFGGNWN
ncbi:Hypothetical predicted protein [Olea europaea subsp. europaea]|uniref:Uncharacterized protein n=1 Tax=Olea europaea subsp. europaea TaxID=158383 RepID=A0A8S0U9L3_OLEEU|nr:Hypothetical predicted protein [Olea europaea subsp. europaea]